MCFSATASFAVSGVLTAVGAASLAKTSGAPGRMFAAIPLLFAAQQVAEGTVWLTMSDGPASTIHRLAVGAFLAFAVVIWPLWLPFSLRIMERSQPRRSILTALVWSGILVAGYAAFVLTRLRPTARIAGHSICYEYRGNDDALRGAIYLAAYTVPTILPFFVSTMTQARAMGATLIVSLAATILIRREALTSVWCFFAAILSGLILLAVRQEQRSASTLLGVKTSS